MRIFLWKNTNYSLMFANAKLLKKVLFLIEIKKLAKQYLVSTNGCIVRCF